MRRAPNEQLGTIRTSKEECEGLCGDAWWMHDFCMRESDKKDYYGGADATAEPVNDPEGGDDVTDDGYGSVEVVEPGGQDPQAAAADRFEWE